MELYVRIYGASVFIPPWSLSLLIQVCPPHCDPAVPGPRKQCVFLGAPAMQGRMQSPRQGGARLSVWWVRKPSQECARVVSTLTPATFNSLEACASEATLGLSSESPFYEPGEGGACGQWRGRVGEGTEGVETEARLWGSFPTCRMLLSTGKLLCAGRVTAAAGGSGRRGNKEASVENLASL